MKAQNINNKVSHFRMTIKDEPYMELYIYNVIIEYIYLYINLILPRLLGTFFY